MTDSLTPPSGQRRHHTEELAVMEQRVNEHERRLRDLAKVCASIDQTLDAISGTCHSIDKRLALGDMRMSQIDTHLEATDGRVDTLEDESTEALKLASKRDPVSFWTSMGAAVTTIGGIIYMVMHGGSPPPGGAP